MFARLFRKNPQKAAGARLYAQSVEAARHPALYGEEGAPDTVDGRFELIVLHASLLMRRLREGGPDGQAAAQAVFDAMFDDMDAALREMGVGDTSVGKKIKKMAQAFYGRASAYDAAIKDGDADALAAAIERNLFEGERSVPSPAARRFAALAMDGAGRLAEQDIVGMLAGERPRFAEPG